MIKGKHMHGTSILITIASIFIFHSTSFGQEETPCKKFQVSFSSPIKTSFDGVFYGRKQIGKIIDSKNSDINLNIVEICIDNKHLSEIEENTVCYVSDSSIIVYNVWASGKDIPEHSIVPGFPSKLSLFWYEIKSLFKIITE
jgi:hypothetical protein